VSHVWSDWISVVGRTVVTSFAATALIAPPALVLAWLLARKEWRGKSLVETLVALPLVVPPVATGIFLLMLLGRRGAIGSALHEAGIEIVFTSAAVIIAAAVMAFPLFVRTARVAFEEVNGRYEDVARTLGLSRGAVIRRVTLPLAARGLVAAALLAFARAIGEFGATVIVAGNIPGKTSTIALSIYHAFELGDDAAAIRYSVTSVAIAFVALALGEHLIRKKKVA
jgi:molybdate transport system permease protein